MRKKLVRRLSRDRSQPLRRAFQIAFLLLNIWIGVQFFIFVRYYESGGTTLATARPAGVEGWLPIASLMNFKVLVLTGAFPRVHPAGTLLFMAFLAASWVFRKSFCSWLCPIGTLSEYLARLGRSFFKRNFYLPRWLDLGFRAVKYLLLAFFLSIVATMPVLAIREFLGGPYGVVDDVRMLNFFRELEAPGVIIVIALIAGSLFVQNLWCRYLCPYGALLGLVSLASPLRIRREESLCIDCAKCAKACPSVLPVDKLVSIKSAECSSCLQCVATCPAEGALILTATGRRKISAWAVAAGISTIFFGAYLYGISTGHWSTDLPESVYYQLIPHADEFTH